MRLSGQIYRRIVKNSGKSIALVERFENWSRSVINCHVLFNGCWWSWKKKGITLIESKFIHIYIYTFNRWTKKKYITIVTKSLSKLSKRGLKILYSMWYLMYRLTVWKFENKIFQYIIEIFKSPSSWKKIIKILSKEERNIRSLYVEQLLVNVN